MTPQVFRAVMFTILCCTIAAFIVLRYQERRHERENQMTGIAPPWHPDLDAPLDPWEQDALDGIAANWDTGLSILDSEREHP